MALIAADIDRKYVVYTNQCTHQIVLHSMSCYYGTVALFMSHLLLQWNHTPLGSTLDEAL